MHELDPDLQRRQAVGIYSATITALPPNEIRSISFGTEEYPCTITSTGGEREVRFEPHYNQGAWGVRMRTLDTATDEITVLGIYPGNVDELVNEKEVIVGATRLGGSAYLHPSPEDKPANPPNSQRFLSHLDVVEIALTVPAGQFGEATVHDLLVKMLKDPGEFRKLAPERVDYFDPELEAEKHAPVVEVLGNPVTTSQSLIGRAMRYLATKALGR